jgi:protein-S-isoprenylcysteine O-methyltransferase Ste14
MDDLTRRALLGFVRLQVTMAVLIFVPAWSLRYWQGWLFWFLFGALSFAVTWYFLKHDRALIERRLTVGPVAERENSQKLIMFVASICVISLLVVPALSHRFGWLSVPSPLTIAGDALVALGFWITFRVLRENSFASSTIQVLPGQPVVTTGPYALIRHPMYSCGILVIMATPLALGSWLGLLPAIGLSGVIVWRLLNEEEYLERNLRGYADYETAVRRRLIPGVW